MTTLSCWIINKFPVCSTRTHYYYYALIWFVISFEVEWLCVLNCFYLLMRFPKWIYLIRITRFPHEQLFKWIGFIVNCFMYWLDPNLMDTVLKLTFSSTEPHNKLTSVFLYWELFTHTYRGHNSHSSRTVLADAINEFNYLIDLADEINIYLIDPANEINEFSHLIDLALSFSSYLLINWLSSLLWSWPPTVQNATDIGKSLTLESLEHYVASFIDLIMICNNKLFKSEQTTLCHQPKPKCIKICS